MRKIGISERDNTDIVSEINDFLKNLDLSYYENNRNATKAWNDVFLGKKAECILAKHFNVELDFEIRKGNKKGWIEDLTYFGNKIHVKCCSDITFNFCSDYSWTFQYSNLKDNFGKDPLFNSKRDDDIVCLTYLPNIDSRELTICYFNKWGNVKRYLKLPISNKLKKLKRCIYYKDIKNKFDFWM